jgi:hypothetical protein
MGRIYTASFDDVSISAAQTLFNVATGTSGSPLNMAVAIHMIVLGQRSLTSWEAKPLRFTRTSGAYTISSGGASATPRPHNFGDAAATATARTNDTTSNAAGTEVTLMTDEWVFLNNYLWLPAPEDRIILPPGQSFQLKLPTAPSGATSCSGSITFEELC